MEPQQLHGLIDEDVELHGKLEPKLELVDAPSGDRPDGAGISPSRPGPRLAHTLRRGPRRGAVLSAVPAPPIHRPDPSTPAMPRRERPAPLAIPRLYSGSDEEAAATVVAQYAPSVVTRIAPMSAYPVAHPAANTASPGTVPGAAQRAARRTAINAVPRGATRPRPEAVVNAAPEAMINALPEAMINALPEAMINAVAHAPESHAISTPGSAAAPDSEPITPNRASARLLAASEPNSAPDSNPDSRPLPACPAEAHLIAAPASGAVPDSEPLTARMAGARVLAALRRLPATVAARFEARGAGPANLPILRDTWRSRLAVPAALLVALGTVSLLLRAIL